MRQDRAPKSTSLLLMTAVAQLLSPPPARSEDEASYKFESYEEEGDRISILTHSFRFEKTLNATLTLRGDYVYDGISGASPTGAPPPTGSDQVPLATLEDTRNAGLLALDIHVGNHTISPQVAYSTEDDYTSIGIALNDAITFNQKNTTLLLGISHDFDDVQPDFWLEGKSKNSTDAIVGITQLLDPHTYLTVNVSVGYSDGYLDDPYKRFRFDDYPDPTSTFAEKRPGHKSKEILWLGLTHYFDPVHASLESSYRFYNDSFGIQAHTLGLTWFQKIGTHITIAPSFRYHYQTAADFYAVRLPGDPSDPDNPTPIPDYYSADYRLSNMETFTYGAKIIFQINEHLRLDGAYQRYDMHGLDGVTSKSAYPKANVFTLGATWSF